MKFKWAFLGLCVVFVVFSRVQGAVLPLRALADNDSTYYEYFSDGFIHMDLYSPNQPKNQSFHAISNPNTIYNQNFDGFPHDRQFRLGNVNYDESAVVGGTGQAPITAITFNLAKDPADASYVNVNRFTVNTLIDTFNGSVNLLNGVPVGTTLNASIRMEVINFLGATTTGYYPGTLVMDDKRFTLDAEGEQTLNTVFGTAPVHLKWDFGGLFRSLAPYNGDYDVNGTIDTLDFEVWKNSFGSTVDLAADGNGDQVVDAADYTVWRDALGPTGGGSVTSSTVPEMASFGLMAVGSAALLLVRLPVRTRRSMDG